MQNSQILYPIIGHIFLIFSLYFILGLRKYKAIKLKHVDLKKTPLNDREWPDYVIKVNNNIGNNFETPMAFYALSIIAFITNSVDIAMLTLGAIYIILRYIHTFIHIGKNWVPHRMPVFVMSLIVILIMLLKLSISIIWNQYIL